MRNRLVAMAALGLSCTIGIQAANPAAVDHRVEVYLNDDDGSAKLFGPTRMLVSAIYRDIGIGLDWRHGDPPLDRSAEVLRFAVHTLRRAPKTATLEALACARIIGSFGREVVIYRDRLLDLPASHDWNGGNIVGYVLAHELAHLMAGTNDHSASGIMKARWSVNDMHEMRFRSLLFDSADIARIRRGLAVQVAAQHPGETVSVASGIEER